MAKRGIETRYYTPAGHLAAFALPGYVEKVVAEAAASLADSSKSSARSGSSVGKPTTRKAARR
jgi:hypothetical protein